MDDGKSADRPCLNLILQACQSFAPQPAVQPAVEGCFCACCQASRCSGFSTVHIKGTGSEINTRLSCRHMCALAMCKPDSAVGANICTQHQAGMIKGTCSAPAMRWSKKRLLPTVSGGQCLQSTNSKSGSKSEALWLHICFGNMKDTANLRPIRC